MKHCDYTVTCRNMRTSSQGPIVPGTQINIPAGTRVQVPSSVLHYDENNFSDPLEFQPERFLAENKNNIKPCSHMPFGAGPRMCVGSRFAVMNIKQSITEIVRRYRIVRCSNTVDKYSSMPGKMLLDPFQLIVKMQTR